VRFDYEDKHADLTNTTNPPLIPNSTGSFSDDFSQVSPQFGIDYHLTTNQMVYASVARGYKAGGFNQTAPPGGEEYTSEHSWNYEVGEKGAWAGGLLETDLAFYYIDWQNLQLNEPFPGSGGTSFFIANAGAADSKGVELQATYHVMRNLDLFGGAGFTDAKFLANSVSLGAPVGGNYLPYAPLFTANAGVQASCPIGHDFSVYARAQITAYGNYKYDPSNVQEQRTYSLTDFRIGVRRHFWFVEGWIDNAFNTHYVPIAIPYSTASGYVGESGAPLTCGVRLGVEF
jgi:iron complex outermembrane receptor protein